MSITTMMNTNIDDATDERVTIYLVSGQQFVGKVCRTDDGGAVRLEITRHTRGEPRPVTRHVDIARSHIVAIEWPEGWM